jgi:hypothetical protein
VIWFVEVVAVFEQAYASHVEAAVERHLHAAGALYDEGAARGDPGPSLRVQLAVSTDPDAAAAAAIAARLADDALAAAGIDRSAYSLLGAFAAPMAEIDGNWSPPRVGG